MVQPHYRGHAGEGCPRRASLIRLRALSRQHLNQGILYVASSTNGGEYI